MKIYGICQMKTLVFNVKIVIVGVKLALFAYVTLRALIIVLALGIVKNVYHYLRVYLILGEI